MRCWIEELHLVSMGRNVEIPDLSTSASRAKVVSARSGRGDDHQHRWRGAGYRDVAGRRSHRYGGSSGGAQHWWDAAWREERDKHLQGEVTIQSPISFVPVSIPLRKLISQRHFTHRLTFSMALGKSLNVSAMMSLTSFLQIGG